MVPPGRRYYWLIAYVALALFLSCGRSDKIPKPVLIDTTVKEKKVNDVPKKKERPYDSQFISAKVYEPTELGVDTYACKLVFVRDEYYLKRKVTISFIPTGANAKTLNTLTLNKQRQTAWVDPSSSYLLEIRSGNDSIRVPQFFSQIGCTYECHIKRKN